MPTSGDTFCFLCFADSPDSGRTIADFLNASIVVRAADVPANLNLGGTQATVTATLDWQTNQFSATNIQLQIVEPTLSVKITTNVTNADANDVVLFTANITNFAPSSSAAAYNITFKPLADTWFTIIGQTLTASSNSSAAPVVTYSGATNSFTVTSEYLLIGQWLSVTWASRIGMATDAVMYHNTSSTWRSMPTIGHLYSANVLSSNIMSKIAAKFQCNVSSASNGLSAGEFNANITVSVHSLCFFVFNLICSLFACDSLYIVLSDVSLCCLAADTETECSFFQ